MKFIAWKGGNKQRAVWVLWFKQIKNAKNAMYSANRMNDLAPFIITQNL
jgi:hypothetical protein